MSFSLLKRDNSSHLLKRDNSSKLLLHNQGSTNLLKRNGSDHLLKRDNSSHILLAHFGATNSASFSISSGSVVGFVIQDSTSLDALELRDGFGFFLFRDSTVIVRPPPGPMATINTAEGSTSSPHPVNCMMVGSKVPISVMRSRLTPDAIRHAFGE